MEDNELPYEPFQSTQQLDEEPELPPPNNVWGWLSPHNESMNRIDFIKPSIMLGRDREEPPYPHYGSQLVTLHGSQISRHQARIKYDKKDRDATVIITDQSTNGTYLDGNRIGQGQHSLLTHGSTVTFGTTSYRPDGEDHRYTFLLASQQRPQTRLHSRYDVAYELGRGGFSIVMKGLSREDGQLYAIKMIKSGDFTTELNREIAILKQLKHVNVCGIKEVVREDNGESISLILEFVPGGDLFDYVSRVGVISEDKTRRIIFQLCRAMEYIHSKGITHRDLKPENILLSTQDPDGDPIVKVADFGLAKATDNLTNLHTMCGTPRYLAPEVLEDLEGGYRNVVDSWSVGVIAFMMLTGNYITYADCLDYQLLDLDKHGVSEFGKQFIRQLLQQVPALRMTMVDAVEHPWFYHDDPESGSGSEDDASSIETVH